MNYKRIILSLGMIVFVGAVVISGTGAFFSSSATNTGNTFAAGSLELMMAHNENGNYESSKSAAWTFTDMAPGGTPEVDDIWLQNVGSVDGMKLGVAMDNASSSVPGTAAQMRITEMTLDGDNLLEGGAGARLADYEAPTSCDQTVSGGGDAIETALNSASVGDVICVDSGNYNEFTINTDGITVAGLHRPTGGNAAVIVPSGAGVTDLILVKADNVTITGLRLDGSSVSFSGSQTAGIHVGSAGSDIDKIEISYNLIQNLNATNSNAASKGIQWFDENGFTLTNSLVTHNVIRGINAANKGGYGIQTVGAMNNVTFSHNTIQDINGAWGAGIALDGKAAVATTDIEVTMNQLTNSLWNDVSVQVEHNVDPDGISINENNLVGVMHGGGNQGEATGNAVDAENNWWGDFDPSDQVYGPVDFDPFAGGPFSGFVNGNDWNGNGFADLQDLNNDPILGANVGLDAGDKKLFVMGVQLDGPTTGNKFQGASLTTDIVFTLQQQ